MGGDPRAYLRPGVVLGRVRGSRGFLDSRLQVSGVRVQSACFLLPLLFLCVYLSICLSFDAHCKYRKPQILVPRPLTRNSKP